MIDETLVDSADISFMTLLKCSKFQSFVSSSILTDCAASIFACVACAVLGRLLSYLLLAGLGVEAFLAAPLPFWFCVAARAAASSANLASSSSRAFLSASSFSLIA